MRTIWIVVWSICFSMVLLWLPSGAWADPTTSHCANFGDDIWKGVKEVPKNQASIDMLMKLAADCPAIAGSMEKLAGEIKAYLQKLSSAKGHVKKSGEKYQSSAYDPGGIRTRSGPSDN